MSSTKLYHSKKEYEKIIEEKLNDTSMRNNLLSAMTTLKTNRKNLIDRKSVV